MSITLSPDVVRFAQQEWVKAFNTIIQTDPLFEGSQDNLNKITAELRRQQIPENEWVEPVYLSIYMQIKTTLQFSESKEERRARLIAENSIRDAHDGAPSGNLDNETRQEKLQRSIQEAKNIRDAFEREAREKGEARRANEAAENDFSILPTIKQIKESNCEEMPIDDFRKLSAKQMREYRKRLSDARIQLLRERDTRKQ